MNAQQPQPAPDIAGMTANDAVKKIYTNGFSLGLGNADTYFILLNNGQPVAVVNMSYTLAKTLHQRVGQMIAEFETRVERPMLTTDEIDRVFQEQK